MAVATHSCVVAAYATKTAFECCTCHIRVFVIVAVVVVVVVVASHAYCRLKRKTCELQKASDNTNSH